MKYKQEIQDAVEKTEQLSLTLDTVVNTPRLTDPKEIKRLTAAIRSHLKFISERLSLEY
tara:strand:- start:612 stop:788 length:177 start_codon:yes stop_codon:yes gene_type:complete